MAWKAISWNVVFLVRLNDLMRSDIDAVFKHPFVRHHIIRLSQWDAFAVGLALNVVFRQIAIRMAHISFSYGICVREREKIEGF